MALSIISIERLDVSEAGNPAANFKVTLSAASADEVTIDYRILPGTAAGDYFYDGPRTGTLTIPAGETTVSVVRLFGTSGALV